MMSMASFNRFSYIIFSTFIQRKKQDYPVKIPDPRQETATLVNKGFSQICPAQSQTQIRKLFDMLDTNFINHTSTKAPHVHDNSLFVNS